MGTFVLFTLKKGQPLDKIEAALKKANVEGPIFHGFLSREYLKKKGYDPDVPNLLDRFGPNFTFSEAVEIGDNVYPDRSAMAIFALQNDCRVVCVGEVVDGVAEEVDEFQAAGVPVEFFDLD